MVKPDFHTPVLSQELIDALLAASPKLVVDATLGGGGHARSLLQKAPAGTQLIGIDCDADAIAAADALLADHRSQVRIVQANFRHLETILLDLGIMAVDAVYADLGVSSHQIDAPSRGFSYLSDGPLDMRMDLRNPTTAADLVRSLSAVELANIFHTYGEERWARRIARRIDQERRTHLLARTTDLVRIVNAAVPVRGRVKSLARIFQSLRIAVNDELRALADFLAAALRCLQPSGRVAVMSYHSLEDRMVKTFFRQHAKGCTCPAELPVCGCGRKSELAVLTRKALRPGAGEVTRNPRARSARLRVAQKRAED